MILVILNYEFGNVHIIKNIPGDIEDLEDFVYNKLDYKDSEISGILLEDDFRPDFYTYDKESGRMLYDNENFIR